MTGILRHAKRLSLFLLLCLSVWLFWPEPDGEPGGDRSSAASNGASSTAKYTIRFSIGPSYVPGSIPFGTGQPLHGASDVVRDFEARYPDTHIEIINVPVAIREYLVTQLSSGRAPDIIFMNAEDVWVDVQKGWYLPLDKYLEAPNPFVREKGDPSLPGYEQWWDMFRYQAISRGKAMPDGHDYCITYDVTETAIFYNKSIFAEVGVDVPKTWDELLENMAKIRKAGYIPLLMHLEWYSDWATDLFIDQLYHSLLPGIDLRKDPVREPYLQGYLDWDEICFLFQKDFFTQHDPRYAEVWRLMRDLKRYGNDNLTTTDLLREFLTGHGAMIWNNTMLAGLLTRDKELGFDWDIFYLPPFTRKTTRFATQQPTPMCVIGGSATQFEVTSSAFADTGNPDSSERLERVIAFLQFLTLPENCERIVDEYPGFIPNIVGVPVLPPLKPFEDILTRRYTTTKFVYTFDLRFAELQRRMLDLYLSDGMSLNEFLEYQEENVRAAVQNAIQRKDIDMQKLEAAWQRLAPAREGARELPHD